MAHDPSASVDVSADPDLDNRHAVSFTVVRRGYDQPQVDLVLADMAAQIDALRVQAAELREREADLLAALDAAEFRARTAESAAEEQAAIAAAAREAADELAHRPADDPTAEATGPAAGPVAGPADRGTGDAGPVAGHADDPVAPGPDVATMVGEETARIVEAARHAAVEIGARAREEAERVVATAREESRVIRADAEIELLHRTREADDAVAARLLEAADAVQDAQARAEAIVADAFTEGATIVLRARDEAKALVAEAEQRSDELAAAAAAARDDLLVDLVRRRKVLRRQVEQLEAGRVRLRAAYAVVEGALTDATDELDRTVAEARDAAIAAAERADADDDPAVRAAAVALGADPDVVVGRADPDEVAPVEVTSTDVAAGEATADDATGADQDGPAAGAAPSTPTPTPTPTLMPTSTSTEPVPADDQVDAEADPVADAPSAGTPTTEPVTDGTDGTDAGAAPRPPEPDPTRGAEIDLRADTDQPEPDQPEPGQPRAADATEAPTATEPTPRRRRRAPDPVEFEGRWSSAVRVLPPGPETADLPAAGGRGPSARPARGAPSASEVFARLRAGDAHQPSLFEPGEPEAAGSAGHLGDADPADPPVDPEVEWIARRDAAVAPALRALRRRLKATLADDEDSLLEAIRRSGSVPASMDPVRDASARRDDLALALEASLRSAAVAGAELASGDARALEDERGSAVAAEAIAAELADAVMEPLDERLDRCVARYHRSITDAARARGAVLEPVGVHDIEAAAAAVDADTREAAMASLISSIKAAYRARRGAQVQVPTEHAVLLAGHRGLVAALEPGTPLRWVVAAPAAPARRGTSHPSAGEPATPSEPARECTSCVAVADVGAGDPFGHGPLLPPARPGCRCAVAPVAAVVPRRP